MIDFSSVSSSSTRALPPPNHHHHHHDAVLCGNGAANSNPHSNSNPDSGSGAGAGSGMCVDTRSCWGNQSLARSHEDRWMGGLCAFG